MATIVFFHYVLPNISFVLTYGDYILAFFKKYIYFRYHMCPLGDDIVAFLMLCKKKHGVATSC